MAAGTGTVNVSAAAASGTPTGTVSLSDGGAYLGSCSLTTGGSCSWSSAALAVGSHQVSATYGGDAVQFDPGSSGVHILDPETLEHKPS